MPSSAASLGTTLSTWPDQSGGRSLRDFRTGLAVTAPSDAYCFGASRVLSPRVHMRLLLAAVSPTKQSSSRLPWCDHLTPRMRLRMRTRPARGSRLHRFRLTGPALQRVTRLSALRSAYMPLLPRSRAALISTRCAEQSASKPSGPSSPPAALAAFQSPFRTRDAAPADASRPRCTVVASQCDFSSRAPSSPSLTLPRPLRH